MVTGWYTVSMSIDKDKKRIQITIPKQRYIELKHMAIDQGTTVSDLLIAASETTLTMNGGVIPLSTTQEIETQVDYSSFGPAVKK